MGPRTSYEDGTFQINDCEGAWMPEMRVKASSQMAAGHLCYLLLLS